MYSIAWEGESNPSLLNDTKVYLDPVTIEHRDNQDSVTQESVDKNFPSEENIASHSIAGASHSDTHSSRDYNNISKLDIRIPADAPFENEDASNQVSDKIQTQRHLPMNFFLLIKMVLQYQLKLSHAVVKTTYYLILTKTSQTQTDFRQDPKFHLLRWHTEPLIFSLSLLFLDFFVSFFHLTTSGIFQSVEKKQKNISNYSYQIHHQKHYQQQQSFSFLKYRNEN